MKRFFVTIMALTLSVATVLCTTACGPKKSGGIVNDPQTLNVKIHSAGYGTSYIYELKKGFEQTYSDEGYKINVLTPDADIANQLIYQEIYTNGGVDVYIANADAMRSANYIGQQSFADITETVVAQKPIGNGKVEGANTILSYLEDNDNNKSFYHDGKYYGIPIALSMGGLGVNETQLREEFGITQLPRTTKEFQQIIQAIMVKNANDMASGASYFNVTHPFAYALSGNSYWMSLINTWFYQYSGQEAFERFWSFEDEGGAMTEDAYEVFKDEGLNISLSLLYQVYDMNSAMPNVASDDYLDAQHNVMQGYAIFCPTGDWMFNEEKKIYSRHLDDVAFIKPPLVSELGVKLFGEETTYSFTDDECEELLIKIVDGADANLTVTEIKASLASTKYASVSDADILTVCERRGAYKDSSGSCCYISNKSSKKDIAALFLRYIASVDGAATWSAEANTTSPYNVGQMSGDYEWFNNINAIFSNRYAKGFTSEYTGYRYNLGISAMFFQKGALASNVFNESKSLYNNDTLRIKNGFSVANYKTWADSLATSIYNDAKSNVEKGLAGNGGWQVSQ